MSNVTSWNAFNIISAANLLGIELPNAEALRAMGSDTCVKVAIGRLVQMVNEAFPHGEYDLEECRKEYLDYMAETAAQTAKRGAFLREAEAAYLAKEPEARS